jgi:small-conductance mechanosensitive channel
MEILKIKEVQNLFDLVINPAVRLIFAAASLYFIYGVFTFIRRADDSSARVEGANHILWSTIGLFIMISVWGIIALLQNTIGV